MTDYLILPDNCRNGHGPTDKGISGVDGDGVALAAIQGLYELVKELQAENEQMRAAMERAGLR